MSGRAKRSNNFNFPKGRGAGNLMAMELSRIFLPLGVVAGLSGVLLWVVFAGGLSDNYPGTSHPDLMVGGFLYSFAITIVMASLPRFSKSPPAYSWEKGLQVALLSLIVFADVMGFWTPEWRVASLAASGLSLLLLVLFTARRIRGGLLQLPPSFFSIGAAFLCGLAGITLLLLSELQWTPDDIGPLGRALFYQGMPLFLVLALGLENVDALARPILALGAGLVLAVSFPVEFWISLESGRALRALSTTAAGIALWNGKAGSTAIGLVTVGSRTASVCLVAGMWLYAFLPSMAIHGAHLTFVGGFSLLALLVAANLISTPMERPDAGVESKRRDLKWVVIFIGVAAGARFLAPLTSRSYVTHLAYASLAWTIGALIWIRWVVGRSPEKKRG